jgi:hypothetical protein
MDWVHSGRVCGDIVDTYWTVMRWLPKNRSPITERVFGLRIIAKTDILVNAELFSDDGRGETYFNSETPVDKTEFDAAYEAYMESLAAKNRQQELSTNKPSLTSSPSK